MSNTSHDLCKEDNILTEPMTMNHLRNMDGKPAWVVFSNWKGFAILHYDWAKDKFYFITASGVSIRNASDYGLRNKNGWHAYSSEPLIDTPKKAAPNTLLSIAELRKMNAADRRQWVWIEILSPLTGNSCKESAYFQSRKDSSAGNGFCCGYPGISFYFDYQEYKNKWLPFACKPTYSGVQAEQGQSGLPTNNGRNYYKTKDQHKKSIGK